MMCSLTTLTEAWIWRELKVYVPVVLVVVVVLMHELLFCVPRVLEPPVNHCLWSMWSTRWLLKLVSMCSTRAPVSGGPSMALLCPRHLHLPPLLAIVGCSFMSSLLASNPVKPIVFKAPYALGSNFYGIGDIFTDGRRKGCLQFMRALGNSINMRYALAVVPRRMNVVDDEMLQDASLRGEIAHTEVDEEGAGDGLQSRLDTGVSTTQIGSDGVVTRNMMKFTWPSITGGEKGSCLIYV
ncbi:hypothetical protein Droror1_Dr00024074 [Drosera rotundifolia]